MYFKDQNPDVDTTIIYSDLRTPGTGGENFYRSGQRKGVLFTKGESFENPMYLDKLTETMGAEPITNYDKKV